MFCAHLSTGTGNRARPLCVPLSWPTVDVVVGLWRIIQRATEFGPSSQLDSACHQRVRGQWHTQSGLLRAAHRITAFGTQRPDIMNGVPQSDRIFEHISLSCARARRSVPLILQWGRREGSCAGAGGHFYCCCSGLCGFCGCYS